MPSDLVLACPAKINLALSVGAPDARGYHPIASWMVALTFADELSLTASDHTTFDIAFTDTAPRVQPVDWPLENDLAVRAHRLMESHVGRPLPVRCRLRKRIPTGAGLGGGSSDAAAMLVGLNRCFTLNLTIDQLAALGHRLGSDIPFLVRAMDGEPSAVVSGIGDHIDPMPLPHPIHLVLVLPPLHSPTAAVYAAFDDLLGSRDARADHQRIAALATTPRDLDPGELFNDLAEPAAHVTPGLADIQSRLTEQTHRPIHVTGSGAALFMVISSGRDATETAARLSDQNDADIKAIATRTLASSPVDP